MTHNKNKYTSLIHTSISRRKINFRAIFSEIKLAVKGEERDYTSIRLSKAVFFLAIPMVLEMMMESLFAVVDIFFVSRLGSDAVAAVGLTESLMTIIYAIGFGLGAGTHSCQAKSCKCIITKYIRIYIHLISHLFWK